MHVHTILWSKSSTTTLSNFQESCRSYQHKCGWLFLALAAWSDLMVGGELLSRSQDCGETMQLALKVHVKSSWITTDICFSGEVWFGPSVRWQSIRQSTGQVSQVCLHEPSLVIVLLCHKSGLQWGQVWSRSRGKTVKRQWYSQGGALFTFGSWNQEREMSCNSIETARDVTAYFLLSWFFGQHIWTFFCPFHIYRTLQKPMCKRFSL